MIAFTRRIALSPVVAAIAIVMFSIDGTLAAPPGTGGTGPQKKVYPCAGQLTRTADVVITMDQGKAFYEVTDNDAPVTTQPVFDSGALTVQEAKLLACKRRVVEIRVLSTTTSGCGNCNLNAEIHACAGSFPGSKEFEEHCRVPTSSTSAADCKTFKHQVEVFKKPSGQAKYNLTPLKSFVYKGFIDSSGCRVAGKNLGQIHDTAEVYANVTPPTSGMDVYRVLTLPTYKGALVDSKVFVEFEKTR